MSKLSLATKNEMLDLAVEIIAEEKHQREQQRHGLSTSERICDLYDRSDSVFCAERVKSLLDELAECRRQRESSLVGEIVAWSGTDREKGITREVDFRFLRFDVLPGTKLYAIEPAPAEKIDLLTRAEALAVETHALASRIKAAE